MIKKVLQQAKQQQQQQITADAARKNHFLLVPYKGEKGEHLIKSMKRRISKLLPPEIKTQVTYTSKELSTCFNVNSNINMTWYTMQIALMRNVEKITLVKVVVEFQNA